VLLLLLLLLLLGSRPKTPAIGWLILATSAGIVYIRSSLSNFARMCFL